MVVGRLREGDPKGSGTKPDDSKQVSEAIRHSGPQRTSEHAPDSEKGKQEARQSGRMRR